MFFQPLGQLVGTGTTGGGEITDLATSSDGTLLYVANTLPNVLMVMETPTVSDTMSQGSQPTIAIYNDEP